MFELQTHCPTCGRYNDLHEGMGTVVPCPGDVTVCWGCGAVGLYHNGSFGLAVRAPNPREVALLERDPRVRALRAAVNLSRRGDEGGS